MHTNAATCNPKCSGTDAGPRYRLAILVTDPADMPDETEPAIVEMVFFGPRAEEIIGCPLDALINDDSGVGAFIPLRIAMLYGKQFEL